MSLDNLETILPLLKFEEGYFYSLQIIQRRKENPAMLKGSYTVKTYYIESKEQLQKSYYEIKTLCHLFNARAYINVNRGNYQKAAVDMLYKISDSIRSKVQDWSFIKSMMESEGFLSSDKREGVLWIIDVDCKDEIFISDLVNAITECQAIVTEKILIPTINGYHIITTPFNSYMFKSIRKVYATIDIHKNNSTLLYYNNPNL